MKEFRNPENVHKPLGAYSHQIEIKADERILVLSGQVGVRQDGTVPDDPIDQLDLAFENVMRNLQAAQMEVTDIIKITYYLVGEFDTAKRRVVTSAKLGGHQPCSTLIYAAALASPTLRVEIDVWASRAA